LRVRQLKSPNNKRQMSVVISGLACLMVNHRATPFQTRPILS
jgi:hypothetical protein